MVTIQLIRRDNGRPASQRNVCIQSKGLMGGFSKTIMTDQNGIAEFDTDPGDRVVYVDGQSVYDGRISAKATIHV